MGYDDEKQRGAGGDAPPFGSWRALYAVVLLWLAAQVVLFYLFTEAFR